MPSKEELIERSTLKEIEDVASRVFHVLTEDPSLENARIANAIGLLTAHLIETGRMTETQLDDFLLEVAT